MYNALGAMGFGAVEVGTVTSLGQPGNPRPRLFRLPDDGALLNRMGFNNDGAEAAARAIRAHPPRGLVLGVNLGKSKVTPLERAHEDYRESAARLGPLADYLVINVSSPNTPGLRALQSVQALRGDHRRRARGVRRSPGAAAREARAGPRRRGPRRRHGPRPLAPPRRPRGDQHHPAARRPARPGVGHAPRRRRDLWRARAGAGDGGDPADPSARAGALAILGVGGVRSADDAWEKIAAGASLVQVYTGFVYEGPGWRGASPRASRRAWTARASPPSTRSSGRDAARIGDTVSAEAHPRLVLAAALALDAGRRAAPASARRPGPADAPLRLRYRAQSRARYTTRTLQLGAAGGARRSTTAGHVRRSRRGAVSAERRRAAARSLRMVIETPR